MLVALYLLIVCFHFLEGFLLIVVHLLLSQLLVVVDVLVLKGQFWVLLYRLIVRVRMQGNYIEFLFLLLVHLLIVINAWLEWLADNVRAVARQLRWSRRLLVIHLRKRTLPLVHGLQLGLLISLAFADVFKV